jgi:uncharacterized protein with PIN domain
VRCRTIRKRARRAIDLGVSPIQNRVRVAGGRPGYAAATRTHGGEKMGWFLLAPQCNGRIDPRGGPCRHDGRRDGCAEYQQRRATARLRPPPQADPRFVADVHLGRLVAYLRLAGFDVAYRTDYSDEQLVATSAAEDRVLLTRDVGALKHAIVVRGYFLRETQPARQLIEVLRHFDLVTVSAPFTRCLRCNSRLHVVAKDRVEHLLPARTREYYREFSRCPTCGRIYWQGSHYSRMKLFIETAFAAAMRASFS